MSSFRAELNDELRTVTLIFSPKNVLPPVYITSSLCNWQVEEMSYAVDPDSEKLDQFEFSKLFKNVMEGQHRFRVKLGMGTYWLIDNHTQRIDNEGDLFNTIDIQFLPFEAMPSEFGISTDTPPSTCQEAEMDDGAAIKQDGVNVGAHVALHSTRTLEPHTVWHTALPSVCNETATSSPLSVSSREPGCLEQSLLSAVTRQALHGARRSSVETDLIQDLGTAKVEHETNLMPSNLSCHQNSDSLTRVEDVDNIIGEAEPANFKDTSPPVKKNDMSPPKSAARPRLCPALDAKDFVQTLVFALVLASLAVLMTAFAMESPLAWAGGGSMGDEA